MQELKLQITQTPGIIECNFEELKKELVDHLEIYENMPVSLENKAERKKDLAMLRKVKKAVSDRRSEVKKQWLEPYNVFDMQVRELLGLIDRPVAVIDDQIRELESRERMKKLEEIKTLFGDMAADYTDWLTLEMIFDEKWLNATTSMKKVKEELTGKISEIRNALTMLNMSVSEVKEEAVERYKSDLNLQSAMMYINQYEAQRARILEAERKQREREEEQRREREMERARQEARAQVAREQQVKEEARKEVMDNIAQPITDDVVKNAKVTAMYTISATDEQIAELEMAMDSLGITYERKM
ncbi:DUF1351 domain-containing protein [Fusicatenibacter sp. CLA-AA-H241]|nr:DUF1351 domain-containing protein [Oliverpabstia intestinalis]MCC2195370.1 DUF1351 domain-containing protein [Oliverpabstia intestinalis]